MFFLVFLRVFKTAACYKILYSVCWINLQLIVIYVMWNHSISLFKSKLRDIFCVTKYNTLYNTSLSRYSSILHTRLRLGHCALNLYLYRIGCKPSPFCECHWGIYETLSHYFLHCPLYAAQRQILFSISARLLPTIWSSLSESQKVNLFLHGSDKLGYADNQTLLHNVQLFILNSKRFTNCVHDS
jgi:hypothetical protein